MAETAITLKLTDSRFANCRILYDDPTNSTKESLENYDSYADSLRERSRLSGRSLEMCTENLGSETGTDTIFSSSTSSFDHFMESLSSDQENLRSRVRQNRNEEPNPCRKFPPPLTTMSGIQVRRHCEGGRLIIEAVERPLRNSYLQAERSEGRLRLCYLTDSESDSEEEAVEEEAVAEEFGFQMWSRCKERRGHEHGGLCSNWKPAFWVATS
ncbi:protein FANTASTIC FOUR 3-like [Henckelia pumila]|uniref:protein FANTASTIC FOUR 3-like n=1 Tax=Henckelia pumila TaxID=405737 RepID=UPI003C6E8C35